MSKQEHPTDGNDQDQSEHLKDAGENQIGTPPLQDNPGQQHNNADDQEPSRDCCK